MLADSSTVHATQQGSIKIKFTSDQGDPCTLNLLRVLHVPGLNTRLFSIPAFTRDSYHTVNFGHNYAQLRFEYGQTYKIPTPIKNNITTTAYHVARTTPQSIETQSSTPSENIPQEPLLPAMSVEKGHKILDHISIRSLISGSLHNVWSDYRFVLAPDNYCESCKIAASKVQKYPNAP